MTRLYFALLLLIALLASCQEGDIPASSPCSYTAPATYASHPNAQRYQTILDKYIQKGLPGINLYIHDRSGEWAGSAGMADIGKGIPMAPCVVSKVASITKLFMGVLTHKLVEEGTFRLDDPVDAYLPEEVLSKIRNSRGATIRQLMNHTTGIYDLITDNAFYLAVLNNPDKQWTAQELVRVAYGKEPYFERGTSCYYSNTNTLLLAMVIEKATGRPQYQLMREKVITPLGLTNTYYYSNERLPPSTAQGYFDLYNNGSLVNMTNYNTGSGYGYGGMFSTVFDIAKLVDALFRHQTLLKPSSLAEMKKFVAEADPEDPANDLFLGAGAMKRYFNQPLTSDNYAYGHTGRDLAYSANAFYFPNQQATCTFTVNYGTNGASRLKPVFFEFQNELTDELVRVR
jgi:D-alanyl-D-alanine carboxypeptidase